VYAEDPDLNFQPSPGTIHYLREPRNRDSHDPDPNVRVDTGIVQGDVISSNFDPMISKLIVKGTDRNDAIRRLKRALADYKIIGLKSNIAFHDRILQTPDFLNWDYDTDFIPNNSKFLFQNKFSKEIPSNHDLFNFAIVQLLEDREDVGVDPNNPWLAHDSFRLNYTTVRSHKFTDTHGEFHIAETYNKNGD
jgi:3-methylcrotonyl-CoA carboxylase alpha subunit